MKAYLVDYIPGLNFDYGELYAGQIPINKSDPSRNMFYMFQPKVGEPSKDLTIWFNGKQARSLIGA
jgi:carboxypeptidase D